MILGLISTALGLLGVIGIYTYNGLFILIGGGFGIVSNVIGVLFGGQNNLVTLGLAGFIGVLYGNSIGVPLWFGFLMGATYEAAIMGILGYAWLAWMMWENTFNLSVRE